MIHQLTMYPPLKKLVFDLNEPKSLSYLFAEPFLPDPCTELGVTRFKDQHHDSY